MARLFSYQLLKGVRMINGFDLDDPKVIPSLETIANYTASPLWTVLCDTLTARFKPLVGIEFSRCAIPGYHGWNVKFKKAGRNLCTLYPRKGGFTALVVIGKKERAQAELILPGLTKYLQDLYHATPQSMDQRWLTIDVTSPAVLEDVLMLIQIRRSAKQ